MSFIDMEITDYSTIILGVLFIVSEALPFIKKNKGNGLIESLVCIFRGSECMGETAGKIADTLEAKENPV
tara:strand:- start:364 stop:573 length:210 start_codon:yes stop_codon:yes gene_type:complete